MRRRTRIAARFPMLRQQEVVEEGRPQLSLADFVARGSRTTPPITTP